VWWKDALRASFHHTYNGKRAPQALVSGHNDNAITILGLHRYGFETQSRRLAHGILEAIQAIGNPVELYTVLSPSQVRLPKLDHRWMLIDYFEACNVQAWTAAGILYLASLLRF